MENRSNSSAEGTTTGSTRLPVLGRIAWIVAALFVGAVVGPVTWNAYRASRSVAFAQEEAAWGRLESARQHVERASRWTAGDAEVFTALAEVDMAIARLRGDEAAEARAVEALRTAIHLHPSDAGIHAALGSTLLNFGSLDAAADAFDRALELDPHNRLFLASMARVREAQERFDDAAALYRRALSIQHSEELETRLERIERP